MSQSSNESDDEGSFYSTALSQSHYYSAGLKPALDSIFADVQANIPIIGSDSDSELNSDEEPTIFNRSGELTSLASPEGLTQTVKDSCPHLSIETEVSSKKPQDEYGQAFSSMLTDSGLSLAESDNGHAKLCSDDESIMCPTSHNTQVSYNKESPAESESIENNFQLNFSSLVDIDFSSLMEQVNDVTVPLWPDLNPLESDTNNNRDLETDTNSSTSSEDLMMQLVNLTDQQKRNAASFNASENALSDHKQIVGNDVQTVDSGIQADYLYNDTGTMAAQSTASVGVSTSFGIWSNNTGVTSPASKRISQERGTIFIDVRNQAPEPKESLKEAESISSSIQRILGIEHTDSESSSSDEENDMELWHEQRRRIKQGLVDKQKSYFPSKQTKMSNTVLKKSSQQLIKETSMFTPLGKKPEKAIIPLEVSNITKERASEDQNENQGQIIENEKDFVLVNKHISPTETVAEFVYVPSPEYDHLVDDKKGLDKPCAEEKHPIHNKREDLYITNEEEKALIINKQKSKPNVKHDEKIPNSGKPVEKLEKQVLKPVKTTEKQVTSGQVDAKKSRDTLNSKDTQTKLTKKEIEKQKILYEKIKAKKLRIKERLENVKRERETRSVGGRVCRAARNTPVVYDMDASYETPPTSLPDNYANKQYLLISIPLSTCGELRATKAFGSKAGNKGTQIAHDTDAYTFLVAWLLSLVPVPERAYYCDFASICESPFHVIGLQQTWHEGEFSLKIGICSRDSFQPSTRPKQGGGRSGSNSFQSLVSKFLKTNTLCSVLTRLSSYPPYLNDWPIGNKNLSSLLVVNSDPNAMIRVFGREPGFFWKTFEVEDTMDSHSSSIQYNGPDIDNTIMLIQYEAFHDPACMSDVLNRVWSEGFDVAGIRLVYTNTIPLEERPGLDQSTCNVFPREGPILCLAIRGPGALHRWLEVVGPSDVWLARRTNPNSLRVMYSAENKEDHLFYCSRHVEKANTELARWFGGRVPPGDSLNIGNNDVVLERPRSGSRGRKEEQLQTSALHTPLPSPPCSLVASTESMVVVVASPIVKPHCISDIIAVSSSRGFILSGIRRIRLQPLQFKDSNRDALGLTAYQATKFCPPRTSEPESLGLEKGNSSSNSATASTMFCFRKENGFHHTTCLVKILTEVLAHRDYLPTEIFSTDQLTVILSCFTIAPCTDHFADVVGIKMKQIPNSSTHAAASLSHSFYSNPELEQVCVVTLLKENATIHCHKILDCLTKISPPITDMMYEEDDLEYCGFELLGIKLVASMTLHQAKEFSPYEIGDKLWKSSLKSLTSGPALIVAIRGINAFERLREFIYSFYGGNSPRKRPHHDKEGICPNMFMSSTPENAYRQLTAIFFEHELHADHSMRSNVHYLPPSKRLSTSTANHSSPIPKQKSKKSGRGNNTGRRQTQEEPAYFTDDIPIISTLLEGPKLLNTVCIIKPDAVPNHVGKVLKRLVREGFTMTSMRLQVLSDSEALSLVDRDKDCRRRDKNEHAKHLTSGPCLIMSIQRENAVGKLLEVLGPNSPDKCRHESQFYLRGSYGTDNILNALYGSCSYRDAVEDHKLLFVHGVCCSPTDELISEDILCLSSDKIFSIDHQRSLVDVPEDLDTINVKDKGFTTLLPPSLLELNCLLLLPDLLRSEEGSPSNTPGFIEIINALITAGVQIVGVRMLRFNDSQASHCAKLYSDTLRSDVKPHQLVVQLTQGPCLVIAILRDGAITSFETLLGDTIKSNSLAVKYGKCILSAKSFKKARCLLECFFDRLMPNKKARIEISQS